MGGIFAEEGSMFITNHTPGKPWTTDFFRLFQAVSVNASYRRCAYEINGFRCTKTYTGGRGTHKYCSKHRPH